MAKFLGFVIGSKFTLLLILALLLVFYFEFLTYWILPLNWVEQPRCPARHCKKLLLVSDPQIIGPEWSTLFFMDFIAIWDSDRYIRRTFSKAVNYLRPDIIIFLGDLMDQGYSATDVEFNSYVKRLKSIFMLPDSLKSTSIIISPGDNDIGGIEEILIPSNVQRFDKMFNETDESILTESIEFCKVNLMTTKLQQSKFINSDIIRVALSHVPLIRKENYFLKEIIRKIRPHLIFSGHIHTSSHYVTYENDIYTNKFSRILPEDTEQKIYKFHEGLIHEIIIPTCSYRMGVRDMGYGAAFIDTEKNVVYYNVLWLPHRFIQIFIYLALMSPLVVFVLFKFIKKIKRYCHRKQSRHLKSVFM